MKAFISFLKSNSLIKKVLFLGIVVSLFLYVFSIPAFSGRPKWYLISYFFMACLAGSTVLFSLLCTKIKLNRWMLIPISFVMFAFLGTAIYSHCFIGKNGQIGWSTLILMLFTFVIFYYAFCAIGNKKIIIIEIILAFLLFAFYFAFVYRNKIIHLQFSSERIDSYFDNQNTIGFYFAIAYSLSLFSGLSFKKKRELLLLVPAFIFLFLGLFTGSRAFLISVVVGSVVIMYIILKKHKFIFFVALACLIGLFFVLIRIPHLAFLKDQFDRTIYTLFGVGNSKVDTSTVQRAVWPRYAFYLGGRNLIFGYGVNGFSIYSGVGTYAHNNFAEVVCNFGIIGFVLFSACFLLPLFLSLKKKENYAYLVIILVLVYLSRSIFGVVYYAKETYLVLALLFYLTKNFEVPIFGNSYYKLIGLYNEVDI